MRSGFIGTLQRWWNRAYNRRLEREWQREQPFEETRRREFVKARKRREDAHARVEICYDLHAPEIKKRLPRRPLEA